MERHLQRGGFGLFICLIAAVPSQAQDPAQTIRVSPELTRALGLDSPILLAPPLDSFSMFQGVGKIHIESRGTRAVLQHTLSILNDPDHMVRAANHPDVKVRQAVLGSAVLATKRRFDIWRTNVRDKAGELVAEADKSIGESGSEDRAKAIILQLKSLGTAFAGEARKFPDFVSENEIKEIEGVTDAAVGIVETLIATSRSDKEFNPGPVTIEIPKTISNNVFLQLLPPSLAQKSRAIAEASPSVHETPAGDDDQSARRMVEFLGETGRHLESLRPSGDKGGKRSLTKALMDRLKAHNGGQAPQSASANGGEPRHVAALRQGFVAAIQSLAQAISLERDFVSELNRLGAALALIAQDGGGLQPLMMASAAAVEFTDWVYGAKIINHGSGAGLPSYLELFNATPAALKLRPLIRNQESANAYARRLLSNMTENDALGMREYLTRPWMEEIGAIEARAGLENVRELPIAVYNVLRLHQNFGMGLEMLDSYDKAHGSAYAVDVLLQAAGNPRFDLKGYPMQLFYSIIAAAASPSRANAWKIRRPRALIEFFGFLARSPDSQHDPTDPDFGVMVLNLLSVALTLPKEQRPHPGDVRAIIDRMITVNESAHRANGGSSYLNNALSFAKTANIYFEAAGETGQGSDAEHFARESDRLSKEAGEPTGP